MAGREVGQMTTGKIVHLGIDARRASEGLAGKRLKVRFFGDGRGQRQYVRFPVPWESGPRLCD